MPRDFQLLPALLFKREFSKYKRAVKDVNGFKGRLSPQFNRKD